MAGIYIHIPVCAQKCHYCDFYSVASPALLDRLIPCYHLDIEFHKSFFPDQSLALRTLYFGGGTPSLCTADTIRELIQKCENTFPAQWEEITLEANPDDLTPRYLEALLAAGVTRLSIGIQSFDDARLTQLNRRHTALEAFNAIRTAQKIGFNNISVDWIYGLPEYSDTLWEHDLEQFLRLDVQHISAYHLSIEERTTLAKWVKTGRFTEVDELESERQYLRLVRALGKAGYEHYEISNFCKPGYASKHNSAYWESQAYLGIGPGAHGFDGKLRYANEHTIHSYIKTVHNQDWDKLLQVEQTNSAESLNEYFMTALRTAKGVDTDLLREQFGETALNHFLKQVQAAVQNGNMLHQGAQYRIPEEKWLISDAIISCFIQYQISLNSSKKFDHDTYQIHFGNTWYDWGFCRRWAESYCCGKIHHCLCRSSSKR